MPAQYGDVDVLLSSKPGRAVISFSCAEDAVSNIQTCARYPPCSQATIRLCHIILVFQPSCAHMKICCVPLPSWRHRRLPWFVSLCSAWQWSMSGAYHPTLCRNLPGSMAPPGSRLRAVHRKVQRSAAAFTKRCYLHIVAFPPSPSWIGVCGKPPRPAFRRCRRTSMVSRPWFCSGCVTHRPPRLRPEAVLDRRH